jgi:hypothetical protein
MAETIECKLGSLSKWHWYNVMSDLRNQGGLRGVTINPLSVSQHGCGGKTGSGTKFSITWVPDAFLLVSVSQEEQSLIEAFAKVVEYRPFCRYTSKKSGLITFEWDKKDPDSRFIELENNGENKLQKIQ